VVRVELLVVSKQVLASVNLRHLSPLVSALAIFQLSMSPPSMVMTPLSSHTLVVILSAVERSELAKCKFLVTLKQLFQLTPKGTIPPEMTQLATSSHLNQCMLVLDYLPADERIIVTPVLEALAANGVSIMEFVWAVLKLVEIGFTTQPSVQSAKIKPACLAFLVLLVLGANGVLDMVVKLNHLNAVPQEF